MSGVYVVTNTDLGWDCVIGVFKADDVSKTQLERVFPSEYAYVIHSAETHKDTIDFEES